MQKMPSIGSDPDYRRAPAIPDAEQLAGWVQAYREGAEGFQNLIISAHLHLVMSIVGRFRRRHNYADLEGTALLELTEAVVHAKETLTDNQITPYITTRVKNRIKDAYAEDRVVSMPARTFRDKAAKGEINPEGNSDPTIIAVVSQVAVALEDEVVNSEGNTIPFGMLYGVPEARTSEPSLEFTEALNLAIHTEQERRVIDLRSQGFGYADFETVMGLKKSRVGEIVNTVKKRFNTLYA